MLDSARSPAESSGFSKKIAATIIIVYTVVTLIFHIIIEFLCTFIKLWCNSVKK